MFRKILFSTLICLLAITMFSQDEMDPLENALSGIVTVGVFDVSDNDMVLGFGSRKKTYAEIAYEQTLNMGDAFSNGSGFVVDFGGKYYILTNVHVINAASGQAGSMFVFSINRSKYPVKLVGGDSFYDIAILAFDGVEPGPEIHPLQFSEEEVRLAQKVYAIGNPLGAYPYSITEGIISGKNRQFYRPTTGRYGFLQHTATLIWGNSGGPLVNEAGKVVGINTWVEIHNKGGQNYLLSQLNFALEGRKAHKLAQDILSNDGRLRRAFLGIEFATTAATNMLDTDGAPFIKSVFEGSPAYEVLKDRTGFTVTGINGQRVQTLQDIVRILEESAPGEQISFGLKKGILNPVDSVEAAELTAGRLEQVAHYFFQSYSDYDVQEDAGGVVLKGKPGKNYLRLEQMSASGEGESGAISEVIQGKENYGLAGLGGIDKLGQLSLYRAHTVHELGAVIRLCTLEGHLGATLVEGEQYAGTVRFYMEDADDNEIKILFY